ncbi:hypothetical protein EEL52_13835 [Muribaculaceae bacterium Isolate-113 (HZI)]|nr:hypothetical protein EEL53_14285 [Muribaculaceae bacterium Isolate-114 (HZI)]ROT18025.1 hypothetical protein EEL52_13835 [Muribaculaceae bacterium Isolate-113 (HZI)]
MALLGRHAAIHRFGTDQFTGNILFAVFFVLSVGLYCGFQSVIEDVFNRLSTLFRRREVMAIAETPTGEKVSVSTTDVPKIQEQCSTPIPETACVAENKGESKVAIHMNENRPFEVLEIVDDMRHIRFPDGEEAYVGMELSDDEILIEKSYNDSRDYDAELEEAYNVYLDSMTDEERYDHEHGVTRIQKKREYDDDVGFFSSVCIQDVHKNPDGSTLIEETEQEVYVTPDGSVYYLEDMGPICDFYEKHKDNVESHEEIMTRKQRCDEAFNELKRHEELYNLEQVSFICAYITHTMEQFMESHELDKLHNNAKIWTVNPLARFDAVQLRSNHLTKEDLKHLGYNVGKFLRLQGGVIARFVKKVFEKPFESTHVRTIEQKLRESKSTKERIPIHTADQMDKLFAHFQRYGNIYPGILDKK